MNITLNILGGGVFSKIIHLGFQNLLLFDFEAIDSIYLNSIDKRLSVNPFDFIFRQQEGDGIVIQCVVFPAYTDNIPEVEMVKLKKIITKFNLNNEIIAQYSDNQKLLGVDNSYLGVHLRLTDMNRFHGNDYGVKAFDDYVRVINRALEDGYSKIYIASDNDESISKLKSIYGDLITNGDFIRIENESSDLYQWQIDHFNEKKLWQDSFVDMLILSRCGGLVHRVSNFSNAAKIYGSYNKIYNI